MISKLNHLVQRTFSSNKNENLIQENTKSEDSEKDINSDKAKNISIENDVIKKDVAKECSPVEHTIKTHNNKLSRPKKDILISESKKNSEKIISDL